MRNFSRAGRLAVAGGAAVGIAAIGVGPAFAAAPAPTTSISAGFGQVVLAPGGIGRTVNLEIDGASTASTTLKGVTVQIDVSGLAGVATVVPQGSTCTTAGTLITCTAPNFKVSSDHGSQQQPYIGAEFLPFTFTAAPGATAGAYASASVSVSATGSQGTNGQTSSVSLSDGPDIVIDTPEPNTAAGATPTVAVKAGSTYNRSLEFTNYGDQAAQGVTVEVYSSGYGVDVPEQRKGCEYAAPEVAYCYIPDLVAPGATETLSPALQFLTSSDLMWQGVSIQVVPGYASLSGYTVGTGKAFSLVDSTGAAQVPVAGQTAQSNIDFLNFWSANLNVAAATADYAAQAMLFPQPPGNDEYSVQPYITNNGAGYINLGQSAEIFLGDTVTVPSGVTVLSVQSDWTPVVDGTPDYNETGQAGYSEYQFNCGIALPGEGQCFDSNPGQFVIQVQPGFAGGSGTSTVALSGQDAGNAPSFVGDIDSDPTNDTATFDIPAYQ